jgi:putative hemolysin
LDDSSSANWLLIALLLLADALVTTAYAALQNSRQSELESLAEDGKGFARSALVLLDAKSQLYLTYTLSTTLLQFAIAILAVIELIVPALTENAMPLAAAIAAVMGISLVTLILGSIVPEAVGSAYARSLIRLLTPPLRLLCMLLSPLVRVMLAISTLLAKISGSDKLVSTVTEEEIMTLVNAGFTGGTIEDEQKEMIYSVLQLDETWAREVMVPRIDIVAVAVETTIPEALDVFIKSGFSRIPVYEDSVDNIVGLLYAKDLLSLWNSGGLESKSVRDLVRSAYFVPETRPADELLRDLQSRKVHMAIVVDEYGGTSGLVTIENIIEEIVGDIRDEYDVEEEHEYVEHSDGEYVIDASMDIDDLNQLLDTDISSEDTDTLGGFIYLKVGRVPIVGEVVENDDLTITVKSLEGRRIRKVLVKRKPRHDPNEENSNGNGNHEPDDPT